MTENLLYAVGTLLSWAGWGFAILALYRAVRLLTKSPGMDPSRYAKGMGTAAFVGALCLGAAALLPMTPTVEKAAPTLWRLPLFWFVMPFPAWGVTIAVAAALWRIVEAFLAISVEERKSRLSASGIWLLVAAGFVFLYLRDPALKIVPLRGGITMAPGMAISLILFAVAAIVAMAVAARSTKTRGYAKAVVTQAALIAGSIVFGLPFAFAVITSFKEDRDMSGPNGIVWIPKVTQTVPYLDPKEPLFETTYEGQSVQANRLKVLPNGNWQMDIFKPLSIRGVTFEAPSTGMKEIPRDATMVTVNYQGKPATGIVIEEMEDGRKQVEITEPVEFKGKKESYEPTQVEAVRHDGLRFQNYPEALSYLPPETKGGLVYLKNTLLIVLLTVIGTVISSAIVAYAFSRMRFPGKNVLFTVLLATMMLPGAVTLMPQFLIFRWLGWIDTLYPLWVPAFFGSAFNIFLLRQFFMQIPMELEDASKIDGCTYLKTFWDIMLPQIKPALAVIAIWTFMGSWNNFMGPLIYINSPENMTLSYALQLFQGDRSGEPGLLMAFGLLTMIPVLALFFAAQRYFIEGVTLSGLGGR
ncbi:carbohydrate ABC transporter permease [bacterium]|nr:MAG: carbohydrate ABC transporter permease [bacterium]